MTEQERFWNRDEANAKDVWQTPPSLIDTLNCHLMPATITLDPCSGPQTTYGMYNWTMEESDHESVVGGVNALDVSWEHQAVGTTIAFINPPFSMKNAFIDKIEEELERGTIDGAIVLLPDGTDVQSWWHDGIREIADEMWFSYGRQSFVDPETGEEDGSPTFGTTLHFCGDYEWPDRLFEALNEQGEVVEPW